MGSRNANALEEAAEALPPLNGQPDKQRGKLLPWSAFFRLGEAELREIACNEEEAVWLAKIAKHSALFAQAFRVKGNPGGDGTPVVLIWRQERGIWKILTIGVVKN